MKRHAQRSTTTFLALSIALVPALAAAQERTREPTYWKLYEQPSGDRSSAEHAEGSADEQGGSSEGERRTERRWYGHWILLSDGAAAVGVIAGLIADSEAILWSSLGAFYLVAPLGIHAGHRSRTAAGSLGLRLGLPVGGALLGAGACSGDCFDAFFAGLFIGAGMASAFDAALLAWEDVPYRSSIVVTSTGARLGIRGAF